MSLKTENQWRAYRASAQCRTPFRGLHVVIIPFLMPALLFGGAIPAFTVQSGEVRDYPETAADYVETSGISQVLTGGDALIWGREQVKLKPGFRAHAGSVFRAMTDTDGDGYSDLEESTDTDGDGIFDVWELTYGMDPDNAADASQDWDNDGQTNFQEFQADSDPGPNFSPVGTLPGEAVVDNRGSATYSIPIDVVPGTGGLQPALSLVYNSNGANGLLGLGWSIGGLSAITRIPTTHALENGYTINQRDFHRTGIQFNAADRFALDGQRLVRVNASTREYRTEVDQFARVQAWGASGPWNGSGSGPDYFTAETKDGLRFHFGTQSQPNHGTNTHSKLVGRAETLSWAVSRIADTVGNYMTFHYDWNSTTGQHRLDAIRYGYDGETSSTRTHCEVRFEYENRNSGDYVRSTLEGGFIEITQKLARIKVLEAGAVIRTYHLSYAGQSGATHRTLLASVQLQTGDLYMPATQFTYENGGENKLGYNALADETTLLWAGSDGLPSVVRPLDFNGDGRMDLIQFRKNGALYEIKVFQHSAAAGVRGTGSFTQVASVTPSNPVDMDLVREGDFDGDGRTDIAFVSYEYEYIDGLPPQFLAFEKLNIFLARDSGFSSPIIKDTMTYQVASLSELPEYPDYSLEVADVNGDG